MSLRIASITLICLWATSAQAQSDEGSATAEPTTTSAEPASAAATSEDAAIGFRNGFSLSASQGFGSSGGQDISWQLYGVDWRIGTGINEAISVYLHSHMSFGTAGAVGGSSGVTGNLASALVGEYMLPNRIFFGGGGGFGVLNNPSGPLAELRAGYYPFKNTSAGSARRLNVALDSRWYFVDVGGTSLTVTQIALSLGYDRF